MPLRPRRGLARLKTGTHGGINPAELKALGLDPDAVLDFSVCTNPYMPPPGIRESLRDVAIERYPDAAATGLRQKLADRLGVPVESIIAGSGTTELIRLITLAYLRRGDGVLLLEPTYGEYEVAARLAGARLIRCRAAEAAGFRQDMEEVMAAIAGRRPAAAFICQPNNPTGQYFSRREIEAVLAALGEGLLVLDEAYLAFVADRWDSLGLTRRGNVIVLRSMTKDYGLPGLRLGYAVAHRDIIRTLSRVCPPWNVNTAAQQVGLAVLDRDDYLAESLAKTRQAGEYLLGELARLGLPALPSSANYFLVRVGNARRFRRALLPHGILVRDATSFGLPAYVRLAPRTLPECRRLVAAIEQIKNKKG